ncbi:MAG: hypothetical protein ACSLFN_12665 [Candidatus Limnocylindrales bacterium]
MTEPFAHRVLDDWQPPDLGQGRRRRVVVGVVLVVLLGLSLGVAAIATDTLGVGQRWESVLARVDRFLAGPVPDRPTPGTVRVTDPPATEPPPTPAPSTGSPDPGATPAPTPEPTPAPVREAVDIRVTDDPDAVFATQLHKDWCTPAGLQMVLALHGVVDTSKDVQNDIASRVGEWEAVSDSRNGKWGPAAMVLALDAYGAPGYEVRAFETRQGALRDSARAIQATGAPVILLTWRGAHTWVMTGFRADADPTIFRDAHIEGTYILDPWYPRISSLWGPSDPAGAFQNEAEMERNFLKWQRPEGRYPERDGLYITVAPTIAITPPG